MGETPEEERGGGSAEITTHVAEGDDEECSHMLSLPETEQSSLAWRYGGSKTLELLCNIMVIFCWGGFFAFISS
jgi:hypothetical protein